MDERVRAVAYARTSTVLQQDPNNQLVPIRQVAVNRGFELVQEYVDQISGTTSKRKALDQLVKDAKLGKFKIIVIYSLDRLARDTRFLLNLIAELEAVGVSIVSLRESMDLTTPIGRTLVQILGSIAELERNLISERIKTSLAVKKLSAERTGWSCGRPKTSTLLEFQVREMRDCGKSLRQIASELKIGKSSVARILKIKSDS